MATLSRQHTIVAVATATGSAGIGIVRLSGPQAIAVGRTLFRSKPPLGTRVRHVEFGHLLDAQSNRLDSGLAWVMKGPRSYTGEDTVEISAHGNAAILEIAVEAAIARGAALAEPGEFTRRAFLNGKLDLIQAESVVDLVQSQWRPAVADAYSQSCGRLSALIHELKEKLITALSLVEASLDFSDDVPTVDRQHVSRLVDEATQIATRLVDSFHGARRRHEGLHVVLVGRPNVGKSTLMNALLGEDRSIVTPLPGTTRDVVEGGTVWRGLPVRIVDTAGLRRTRDPIEVEGVRRARRAIDDADLVIPVLDSSRRWDEEDADVIDLLGETPGVIAANKCDLPCLMKPPRLSRRQVLVSARDGVGLDRLIDTALAHLPEKEGPGSVGLTRQRHHDLLVTATSRMEAGRELMARGMLDECLGAELQEALRSIGQLLGEGLEEAVLDKIFSEFCIGK